MTTISLQPRVDRIDQWNVILINQCNLHCLACAYPSQKTRHQVRSETIRLLLPRLMDYGLRRVMLTGGEPMMHPEFDDILDYVAATGLDVTLVTNGTYLIGRVERVAGKLARCIISLDGDTPELYRSIRGVNAFDRLVRLPDELRRVSPETHVTVCTVIQKRNFRRLPEFLRLGIRLGVDRVSFLVTDLVGLVNPSVRGGAFGHLTALPLEAIERVALTLDDIRALREEVIPGVEAIVREHPEHDNNTIGLLHEFADYYECYRRGGRRNEERRCSLPFREVVLDDCERLRFCFFTPNAWPVTAGMDPVNHDGAVAMRRSYLEDDEILNTHCNMCLQAVRIDGSTNDS